MQVQLLTLSLYEMVMHLIEFLYQFDLKLLLLVHRGLKSTSVIVVLYYRGHQFPLDLQVDTVIQHVHMTHARCSFLVRGKVEARSRRLPF